MAQMMKLNFQLSVLMILSFLLIGCGSKKIKQPPVPISAEQLFKNFKNPEAGHIRYLGKILEVTGTVERTGTDSADNPYVLFKGDDSGDIQCFFSKKHRKDAEGLQKGQSVTVRGVCLTRVIHVTLDECELIRK